MKIGLKYSLKRYTKKAFINKIFPNFQEKNVLITGVNQVTGSQIIFAYFSIIAMKHIEQKRLSNNCIFSLSDTNMVR